MNICSVDCADVLVISRDTIGHSLVAKKLSSTTYTQSDPCGTGLSDRDSPCLSCPNCMHPRPPSPIPTPVPPDLALRATRPPSQSARSRYSRIDHSRRGRRQPSGREFRRLAMPEWSLVAPAAPWHPYPLRYAQTLVSQPSARLCTRRSPCCVARLPASPCAQSGT